MVLGRKRVGLGCDDDMLLFLLVVVVVVVAVVVVHSLTSPLNYYLG